ncbi:hypothetical protein FRC11_000542, partial [Ceratobasidium sp. 423]
LNEDNLRQMLVDLQTFHVNKEAFCILGGYKSGAGWSGISKLHMLEHFIQQIWEMGVTNGYTTETTECLHKYLVKIPYRQTGGGTNRIEQMVVRLQWIEAWVIAHTRLWRAGLIPMHKVWDDEGDFGDEGKYGQGGTEEVEIRSSSKHEPSRKDTQLWKKEPYICQPAPRIIIAKCPTITTRKLTDMAHEQEAPGLWDVLQDYIDTIEPDLTYQLQPSLKISTWSFIKLIHPPLPFAPLVGSLIDFVRATPARTKMNGEQMQEAHYDMVLVEEYPNRKGIY